MMTSIRQLLALLLIAVTMPAVAQDTEAPKRDPQEVQQQMHKAAYQFKFNVDGEELETPRSPIYRYSDDARGSGGTIWAFGSEGRPDALVTIAEDSNDRRFVIETIIFTDKPIEVAINGSKRRRAKNAKFTAERMKAIESFAKPKGSKIRLRSQAKLLARKFEAFEIWNNDRKTEEQRYQLRLLTKPIREYSDASNGVLSGSIFLLNYGTNPELAMVLEAREDGWHAGFARLGHAKATVQIGNKTVHTHEWFNGTDPFYLFGAIDKPRIVVNTGVSQ